MELVLNLGLSADLGVIGWHKIEIVVASRGHLRSMEVSASMAVCALARLFCKSILICACVSLS